MSQNTFLETGFVDEDATLLVMEADCAAAIARYINQKYPNNQRAAAKALGLHQGEISAIRSGNLGRFSLSKLIRIARRAGLRMYLDMGDDAHGAGAMTVAPTLMRSANAVLASEVREQLVDTGSEFFAQPSAGARSNRMLKVGH
jgi:predicted XRE-type DNA-binding protein